MNKKTPKKNDTAPVLQVPSILIDKIITLVKTTRSKVAVYLNAETTIMYWFVGHYIETELKQKEQIKYGKQILATLSQQLTQELGKGFSYSALTRMVKVAETFNHQNIATLSQQLSWSHLIELTNIENNTKRNFYIQSAINYNWNVRLLRNQIDVQLFERTAISKHAETTIAKTLENWNETNEIDPELVFKNTYILDFLNLPFSYSEKDLENALIANIERFILELGNGFAFVERQKRISIDAIDYHLDLLFYHRKLKRLIAIDLKLGKFKPEHKAQMELYLRWLQKNDMQEGEQKPIGLLLCSEGNTEHIELLMLEEKDIKVAQYLTELPSKAWFADKLHRAIEIAKNNQ
uniref:PDDEXK nuclease domain-containing protein n=1 Tax=Mariniflexile sp. TaxID=1979402 RepID=UPI0040489E67